MRKTCLAFSLILATLTVSAQVANDDCGTAIDLGTLPTPGACTGGLQDGAPVIASSGTTTIGATYASPGIFIAGCPTGGSKDVWFTFTPTGSTLNIHVTPGAAPFLANPIITLFTGSCSSLTGVGCYNGNASGNVNGTFYEIMSGQSYYLKVSGNSSTSTGNFQLSVDNDIDCDNCLRVSTLTSTPAPNASGEYAPGTVVNFCYHITDFVQVNTNWLHGVQVSWGAGWTNPATTPTSTTPAANCATNGHWQWFNNCTSSSTGLSFGPGFYFDYNVAPGNPGNNFGDNCTTPNWNFCFSLTAGSTPGADLSVTVNTTGDGESGSWANAGCAGDPPNSFYAHITNPTIMSSNITQTAGTNPSCTGASSTFTASATNGGASPVYQWLVNNTPVGVNAPTYTTSSLANGDSIRCIITSSISTIVNNPDTSNAILIAVNPLPAIPTITPGGPTTFCQGNSVILSSSMANSYLWSNGATTQNTTILTSQTDSVKITDLNGCTATSAPITITVNPLPNPGVAPSGPTTFCQGDSVTLTVNSSNTYSWSNGGNTQSITLFTSETDSVTITDLNGCSATSTAIQIIVNALPAATISASGSTTFCEGDSVILSASAASTYVWSNGATTQNITIYGSGNDSVTVIDLNGCTATSASVTTLELLDCYVWPGDANDDSVVNNFDLLPIGLFYAQTGTPRASISNLWQAYISTNWGTTETNGSDIKHADCNGDGAINDADTLAILLNFSSTHAFSPIHSDVRLLYPDLYFITSAPYYNSGDMVDVEVWAGSSAVPADNLYGIAFDINYDAALVQPGTESLTYPNSFLGTPGTNAITIAKVDGPATIAYGGMTRIDHTNADGFGKIADLKFQVNTSLSSTAILHLSFAGYVAGDSSGISETFNTINDSIIINPMTTNIHTTNENNELTIYPNPFASSTTLSFGTEQKNTMIKITDLLGREIKTIHFSGKQLIIEKGEMTRGVYYIQVIDENKNVVNKKIVVQ